MKECDSKKIISLASSIAHRSRQFQTKSVKKFCSGHQITLGLLICKSRSLSAKIAMAIWCQVSGVSTSVHHS
jgi:hypothetical protein